MFLGKKSDKLKKLLENTEKKIDGWMDGDVNICKSSALVISFYLFLRTVFELYLPLIYCAVAEKCNMK